jgi:SAM-dependent methyltransferase
MTFDLASLADGLEKRKSGIWFTQEKTEVSYPASGKAACLAVEDQSFWFRHRNRCIVSLVRRFAPDGAFLDIEGGNAFVSKRLVEAGFACALVEPGINGALAARERGVEHVLCARLEDAGLKPASFAAAGIFDVLEHVENETGFLALVHPALKPGGWLFLTVPAYQFLFSIDDTKAGHFRRYTLSTLARTLAKSRFQLLFATYIFAPLPPLIFLLRTVPIRLGMRRGADSERDLAEHAPRGLAASLIDEWRRSRRSLSEARAAKAMKRLQTWDTAFLQSRHLAQASGGKKNPSRAAEADTPRDQARRSRPLRPTAAISMSAL